MYKNSLQKLFLLVSAQQGTKLNNHVNVYKSYYRHARFLAASSSPPL